MKKALAILLPLFLALLLIGCAAMEEAEPEAPHSSALDFITSVEQGFDSDGDSENRVGFVESLKIGETVLEPSLTVTDPSSLEEKSVVGFISRIAWDGSPGDPIVLAYRIGRDNQQKMERLLHGDLASYEVEIQFSVYDHHGESGEYYPSFHTANQSLTGNVYQRGGEFQFNIELEPAGDVTNPENYEAFLGVEPIEAEQELVQEVAPGEEIKEAWQAD